ncbi:ABC transporter permease [Carboxydochorda subterranea]|uniref:ABC transporter permease n=1 Tax=Carboxydichorda subterranea TaxID=3109565 RepID=A0ABZ1BW62_9FIRM|nr:ABC transporter permease [Limnochorda sp. L945t]WRP16760.1 ABC transporter permease [Limnochorda sp. L945t]
MAADAYRAGPVAVSGRPAVGGLLGLAGRQLKSRWLETLLIVAGLAVGSAVLTAGVSFVSYTGALTSRQIALVPDLRAITVRPKGIDWQSLFSGQAPPAQRIEPRLLEPVKLTRADLRAVKSTVPGIAYVATGMTEPQGLRAIDDRPVATIPAPANNDRPASGGQGAATGPSAGPPERLMLRTTTPDVFGYLNLRTLAGAPFTWEDYDAGRQVMAVDEILAKRLFPGLEPGQVVGHTVSTEKARWSVVAVVSADPLTQFAPELKASGLGYVPDTALAQSSGALSDVLPAIAVVPQDPARTGEVIQALQTYFDGKYGAGRVQLDSPLAQLEEITRNQRAFMVSAMVLASLGMIIAAVNILNLFMARVVRRRRLLGLSVALGASRRLLFVQTALEAIILGIAGSALGVALAAPLLGGLYGMIQGSMQQFLELLQMPPLGLTPAGAAVGIGSGLLLSLVFGAYPAWVSSRTHPAEVLRGE